MVPACKSSAPYEGKRGLVTVHMSSYDNRLNEVVSLTINNSTMYTAESKAADHCFGCLQHEIKYRRSGNLIFRLLNFRRIHGAYAIHNVLTNAYKIFRGV
jgi:hypothetical protein